jgi:MFS family permease
VSEVFVTVRTRVPLIALLSANAISMVGNVLAMIAIPWFVLQTTASASRTGLTAFFTVLPGIIAAFFGGTIVDRLGYKRTSVIADLASCVAVALIPLLYFTLGPRFAFWQLLVLVFLGALLDAPGVTARVSLLPDVARLSGTRLERVNSAEQAIQRGSNLLGAPLAGLLIALIDTNNVLWIDAASFSVSALLIGLLVPSATKPAAPELEKQEKSRYFDELKEGLSFMRRDRLMLAVTFIIMLTNFLDAPLFIVVMPVYAKQLYGSAVSLGLIIGGFGGGSMTGTILYGAIGHRLSRRATFIGGFIMAGLLFLLLTLLPPLHLTVLIFILVGLVVSPINPIIMTVIQERSPAEMRGRVFGAITAGAYLAMPLGMLLTGYLLDLIGLRATLILQAACYLLITFSLLFNPSLGEMNEKRVGEATQT